MFGARRRLSPSHVPPNGVNADEIRTGGTQRVARGAKPGTHNGTGPCHSAIKGCIHEILSGVESSAALVHGSKVDNTGAIGRTSKLYVASENAWRCNQHGGGPGHSRVIRVDHENGGARYSKVVEGNVHPTVKRAQGVVVHPHGLNSLS